MPWLSVRDNVALAVDRVFASESAAERAERVKRYVSMVGLTPAIDKKPGPALGRHAPARVGGARPGHRPRCVAARRAALGARRPDPRQPAGRDRAHLERRHQDRGAHHQRRGRGPDDGRPHHPARHRPRRHARPFVHGRHPPPARPPRHEPRRALPAAARRDHAVPDRPVAQARRQPGRQRDPAAHAHPAQRRRKSHQPHPGQPLRPAPRRAGRAHRSRRRAVPEAITHRHPAGRHQRRRPLRRLLAGHQGLPHAQRPANRGRWL